MRSRVLVLALVSFALFGAVRAVRAQSLADVARQEQERRKTVKAAKTFTNKDLPDAPAGSGSVSGDAGKATPPAQAQVRTGNMATVPAASMAGTATSTRIGFPARA